MHLLFFTVSLVTIGFTTTLPMMRFGPFRKGSCWSGKGKSTFEFSNISSMQRLLNPIFNVVNYRLWVIPKNDVAFCSGFGTYHNQSSFILPAKRTATSLVWLWFTTITREYNRLIFRAFCSFPSLSRVKLNCWRINYYFIFLMRPKVKFKRSFVYTKTLGHLQESPDLFNFTLQGPLFIGAGWAITPPIISRAFFFFLFAFTQAVVIFVWKAMYQLSIMRISCCPIACFCKLSFSCIYDWNRVHSILRVSRSFNMPVSVRVF